MSKELYFLAGKVLADRNRNRLDKNRSPREKEKEELFFWVCERLEWSMNPYRHVSSKHCITVREKPNMGGDNDVVLQGEKISTYHSKYISRNEFYLVVQEVSDIFNALNECKNFLGCEFSGECSLTKDGIKLDVSMTTI